MKKIIFLLTVLLLVHTITFSQTLEPIRNTRIQFGPGKQEISIEKGGGEHWKPLFFHVDENGIIHIPDFYKMRIALFNTDGSLYKELKCPAGISPRMNYFSLVMDNYYVTFNDNSLYLINRDGTVKWEYPSGLGIIPVRVFPNSVGIFVVFPPVADTDGRALVFDYAQSRPIGRFGIKDGDKGIPLIQNTENHTFTFMLEEMTRVGKYKEDSFKGEKNTGLLFVNRENRSVWKKKEHTGETILIFSREGKLLEKGTIYYPGGVSGTGFWTCVDENLVIYKNYFYEDWMEIVAYRFRE
ncbi:MAG: hypothetical protein JXB88_23860 [Spirochaetales bacterium]|nr:hypothetical protein [Spirochaetales bacterium]